jgi:hypothetical protein
MNTSTLTGPTKMSSHRRQWLITLGALCLAATSGAWCQTGSRLPLPELPSEVMASWRTATFRGRGQLKFLGMLIYEARLWVQSGWAEDRFADTPLALELEYARSLSGLRIAERSMKEMQGQASIDPEISQRWLSQMQSIFPDVKAGDRITGLLWPGDSARFFLNGKAIGAVMEPAFAKLFFGIWLSPKTSEPELRKALIGAGA